jgi:hypothetical protein
MINCIITQINIYIINEIIHHIKSLMKTIAGSVTRCAQEQITLQQLCLFARLACEETELWEGGIFLARSVFDTAKDYSNDYLNDYLNDYSNNYSDEYLNNYSNEYSNHYLDDYLNAYSIHYLNDYSSN